ncbi:MAG: tripartite tricarboxylate transporter substrate binding protein BugD [Limnohabitans sp.]|nr:tripartite tricarboxylate transporter substrate binding protein BugD [Limnohabitans sp.]
MLTLNRPRNLLRSLSAALLALSLQGAALAQADFPSKSVAMVVPFPPAGSTDVIGRLLAQTMGKHLGQSVLVENVGGAGGTIGAAKAARAPGDGYTLLFNNMAQASAPSLYAKLPFDPLVDFEPVGPLVEVPMILVARKNFPGDTLQAVFDYAKANPGKLNFATAGVGATTHLCEVLLQFSTGLKWTAVPYKGTGPALNDLLGGQVDVICDQPASTLGHIKSGNLKPIAVATKARLKSLPEVPTFEESGMPGFQLAVWHGLYASKGTPKPVIDKLSAALRQSLSDPAFTQRLQEMSGLVVPPEQATPDALRQLLKSEVERWRNALRSAGVKPE